MDFMSISSYNRSESSGFVRIDSDHKTNIRGWDVILIDDIVDTGYTIRTVHKLLLDREPRSLKVCALLDKPDRHKVDIAIDYLGFSIPDYFVVGYGLDYDEKGRNLPYIASVDLKKGRGIAMPLDIVIGTQWGDEGKGRVVDLLSENSDIVARYNGGDNAGHTVTVGKAIYKLHVIPSGIIHPQTIGVLGSGMVLNPQTLRGGDPACCARRAWISLLNGCGFQTQSS